MTEHLEQSPALPPPTLIEVAAPGVCAAVREEIYVRRARWRARVLNGQPPFYTLGGAAYLDLGFARGSIDDYLDSAGSVWDSAGEPTRTILDAVRTQLAAYLGQPVEFPRHLPPPGFHLFIGAGIPRRDCTRSVLDCGSTHFDMQYEYIPWRRWYRDVDVERTISFTLALNLPDAGGGLKVWEPLTLDRVRDDLAARRFPDLATAANMTPAVTVPYVVGSMVVHSGHLLHQIAGVGRCTVMDERITLQGHGLFADGVWRLYW
ncbi:MAG: hypothetical protein M3336_02440 [Chloroflexota bacterium]|nr:hypothetical protein [Chloroflexota bacterium]